MKFFRFFLFSIIILPAQPSKTVTTENKFLGSSLVLTSSASSMCAMNFIERTPDNIIKIKRLLLLNCIIFPLAMAYASHLGLKMHKEGHECEKEESLKSINEAYQRGFRHGLSERQNDEA